MKRDIEERICDHCKHSEQYVDEKRIGAQRGPFEGWLNVERVRGMHMWVEKDDGPWQFCSDKCVAEFFAARVRNPSK